MLQNHLQTVIFCGIIKRFLNTNKNKNSYSMLKKTFNRVRSGLVKNYVYLFGAVILNTTISLFFSLDLNLVVGINLVYVGLILAGSSVSRYFGNFSLNLTVAKVDLSSISIAFSKETSASLNFSFWN